MTKNARTLGDLRKPAPLRACETNAPS